VLRNLDQNRSLQLVQPGLEQKAQLLVEQEAELPEAQRVQAMGLPLGLESQRQVLALQGRQQAGE
jgi:hypothetical protein